jgi:hypothetical protein
MTNEDERRSHWQELAEQLGLEPEKPAAETLQQHTPSAPPTAYPIAEEPPIETAEETLDDEGTNPPDQETASPETATEHTQDTDADSEAAPDDELEAPRGPTERGQRRRRRRSKSESATAPAESSDAEADADEGPTSEESETPRGRSRRRGRGRRQADTPEKDDNAAPTAAPADVDEDSLDDLSNWQAPSWQELIASLYRPER